MLNHIIQTENLTNPLRPLISLRLCNLVEAELEPFTEFLNTVKKYQDRIEVYIRSRLTTAVSEGINNKIKVLKRVGYTYTNEISFKNKILQRCGLLNSRNISTNHWYWHVT
ncbi:MAG: transposase [Bdellovibrionaceae bacterium]|nr:transposase [Pseudobdellovibrionaceae bacterium]